MINLIILCGIPGSGKTTLSKTLAENYNAKRYSFDEMKCFKHNELITPVVSSLYNNESVVVDALYTRVKWREEILEATNNIPCKRILIYLNTPLNECIRRNSQRENRLPDSIIKSIYDSFQRPSLDEGWDEMLYY